MLRAMEIGLTPTRSARRPARQCHGPVRQQAARWLERRGRTGDFQEQVGEVAAVGSAIHCI
jgi:hypothetical protein